MTLAVVEAFNPNKPNRKIPQNCSLGKQKWLPVRSVRSDHVGLLKTSDDETGLRHTWGGQCCSRVYTRCTHLFQGQSSGYSLDLIFRLKLCPKCSKMLLEYCTEDIRWWDRLTTRLVRVDYCTEDIRWWDRLMTRLVRVRLLYWRHQMMRQAYDTAGEGKTIVLKTSDDETGLWHGWWG